ncbi:hypothetical protein [Prosthecobacter sp.]|uniref:hypothetical protein n=1 Tax=Prosthecobacter sp. TaxID=1965333 RepID=UPI0037849120
MIRHFLSSRAARILLWILITLVTLIALLYVWTNWSGRRRWAAAKAMIEHEGETLDFRKLLPRTPPETKNLLAIEPLRGITEVIGSDESKGEAGARRKALSALKLAGNAPPTRGLDAGQPADMQTWATFLRETKFLELPATSPVASKEVLAALDAKFPVLKQLSDLSPQRSEALFTPGLPERELPGMLFTLPLPHYTLALQLSRALGLRALAAIHAGQGAEAARSLLAAEKIGQACEGEPLLIGFLVGATAEYTVLEGIWTGLREKAFSEADLSLLEQCLKRHDLDKALLQSFRGELAASITSLEYLQTTAGGKKAAGQESADSLAGASSPLAVATSRSTPGGLFDHWKSAILEMEWKHILHPLRDGGVAGLFRNGDQISSELEQKRNPILHADCIMANLMIPAFTTVANKTLLTQARERQALAALALERFFLKHARYPATLAELAPEFLSAVPLDPCDGKPMRYRTTPDGRYQLWSVGFDGKDDDGKVSLDSKGTAKLNKRDYLGDWAWQYEPVK